MSYTIVLGFGRSGTTWISDIISKVTGKLILFEPFHPSVTKFSKDFSYSYFDGSEHTLLMMNYLNGLLDGRHRKDWLLRNHVPLTLDQISHNFLEMTWNECAIGGFKEIRANFLIRWLHDNFKSKIVYIIRHPCSVVSSIKSRPNFWEFGWPETYEMFLEKTIHSKYCGIHNLDQYIDILNHVKTDIEKYTVMWAITHIIAIPQLKQLELPLFFYEDFYLNPFCQVKRLFRYLGNGNIPIHPAHIFTPSMTTLKTTHGLYDDEQDFQNMGSAVFWQHSLADQEVAMIMDICKSFGIDIYDETGFPIRRPDWHNIHDSIFEEET